MKNEDDDDLFSKATPIKSGGFEPSMFELTEDPEGSPQANPSEHDRNG
jgi:hypothetical protein